MGKKNELLMEKLSRMALQIDEQIAENTILKERIKEKDKEIDEPKARS